MSELIINAQYEEGFQDGYAKAKEEYEKELKRRDETLDWLISQSKKLTEVVRCKDCKYGEFFKGINGEELVDCGDDIAHEADWFCGDGEKRNE